MLVAMTPEQAIANMRAIGLTEAEIGSKVGVNQSTINRIRKGQEPGWKIGQALVAAAKTAKPAKRTTQARRAA